MARSMADGCVVGSVRAVSRTRRHPLVQSLWRMDDRATALAELARLIEGIPVAMVTTRADDDDAGQPADAAGEPGDGRFADVSHPPVVAESPRDRAGRRASTSRSSATRATATCRCPAPRRRRTIRRGCTRCGSRPTAPGFRRARRSRQRDLHGRIERIEYWDVPTSRSSGVVRGEGAGHRPGGRGRRASRARSRGSYRLRRTCIRSAGHGSRRHPLRHRTRLPVIAPHIRRTPVVHQRRRFRPAAVFADAEARTAAARRLVQDARRLRESADAPSAEEPASSPRPAATTAPRSRTPR